MRSRVSLPIVVVLCSLCVRAVSQSNSALPGFEIVEIQNTGSTNTTGYRIIVPFAGKDRGTAFYYITRGVVSTGQMGGVPLAPALWHKFQHDLRAALPLNRLPVNHGVKSASFGTSLFIQYRGPRSPDLSSPADAHGKALLSDVQAIAAVLGLKSLPRRPVGPSSGHE